MLVNILNVKNLDKSYKENKVLSDLTFSIKKGEIVALVGPNGAGKSTLMKCIAGLLKIDRGIIEIEGTKIKDDREKYLAKFSCIIETPSLYEMLSGYDNVNLIRNLNNISMDKLNEIIKFIDIDEKINSKVRTYSLGMKQRLALGIALLTEPKLLILDEPTNGLDPSASIGLRNLLVKLSKEKGMSILISSHILSDLEEVSDKIIFVKEGKISLSQDTLNRHQYANIILTITEGMDIVQLINNYKITEDIKYISKNKVKIIVEKSKVSILLSNLAKDNINYQDIEIIKNSIENIYTNIYKEN